MAGLRTDRVILRDWRDADLAPFAAMNADPEVRRFFPGLQNRAESDATAARLRAHIAAHGFGFWAAEVPGVAPFIGFVGILHVPAALPFAPSVEIGWRLARAHWGQGYATEAAQASLAFGFGRLGLAEIVSYAARDNAASRRVMERIGMAHEPSGDFDHPDLPEGHPLRRHVFYRLSRQDWPGGTDRR